MKILISAPYFYSSQIRKFSKNKTGLGIEIFQLLSHLKPRDGDKFSFVSSVFTNKEKIGECLIVPHHFLPVVSAFSLATWLEGIREAKKIGGTFKRRIKIFYYFLNAHWIVLYARRHHYSLIHIHSALVSSLALARECERKSVRYLVTFHGVINDVANHTPDAEKAAEREILLLIEKSSLGWGSVISRGTKDRLLRNNSVTDEKSRLFVVENGIPESFFPTNKGSTVEGGLYLSRLQLPHNKKILLYIGSISTSKNQSFFLSVIKNAISLGRSDFFVCFLGLPSKSIDFGKEIQDMRLTDCARYLGFVEGAEKDALLRLAYGNVLLSLDEGFGLSIFEAFVYGKPSLISSSMDVAEELRSCGGVVLSSPRDVSACTFSLFSFLDASFSPDAIRQISKSYTIGSSCEKYLTLYQKLSE